MSHKQPDWMNQEEQRADNLANIGQTSNNDAPQLVRVKREPPRKQKAFYIQEKYAVAFDDFAYKQKKAKGKRATELAEEAIKMLLDKYGEDTNNL
jgi:hypothetical protein